MKRELLAVHARGHQCKQYRGRADERHDAYRRVVGGGNEQRARIRDARTAGIGQNADVSSIARRREQRRNVSGCRPFGERSHVESCDRQVHAECFQKSARRLRRFNGPMDDPPGRLDRVQRKHPRGRYRAQQIRDQVQRAIHR